MTHHTRLMTRIGPRRFYAECSCGWQGPARSTITRTQEDAEQHKERRKA